MPSLFEMDIQNLKGVGEKRKKLFEKLGAPTVGDLLRLYPRAYEDWSQHTPIGEAALGEVAVVKATVLRTPSETRVRGGKTLYKTVVTDGESDLSLTFFNNRYIPSLLRQGQTYLFRGKVGGTFLRREMLSPEFLPESKGLAIQPVYPATAGLSSRQIAAAVQNALSLLPEQLQDPLPDPLREKYHLCTLRYALETIHFPKNQEEIAAARFRLVFEEFLVLQLGLLAIKRGRKQENLHQVPPGFPEDFCGLLPFALTGAQRRAIAEAVADMAGPSPMNRLIQGDVGSGKTAVAAALCWDVIQNGMQAALMAPTEILANQHYHSLNALLEPAHITCALLTGSAKPGEKRKLYQALADGRIQLVIGTHALLSDKVEFQNLGLVITDEQHRFGVRQRSALAQKGASPHLLVMSATPIPRTIALLMYGDLDISILDELPPGRTPVETYLIGSDKRQRALGYIKRHLDEGRQGYIVCPLIEGEGPGMVSASRYAAELSDGFFRGYRTALLHGRMKGAEKDAVMAAFAAGEIQLLIATTVIEVGVDVPNAVIMLIENAERFGLSQLHQLRGRVGRGAHRSTCILLSDAKNPDTRHRLQVICKETDGFAIAEEDLRIRGPGELLGQAQHGMVSPRMAALLTDTALIAETRQAVSLLLREDPTLSAPEHAGLHAAVDRLIADDRAGIFN